MEDLNALMGVLAVKNGWARPADVLSATMAVSVQPDSSLVKELREAGALSEERGRELEAAAQAAVQAHGGDIDKAIEANGGLAAMSGVKGLGEDDPESTRTEISPPPSFGEEDEPTRVLDWDRATRKSVEKVEPKKK